MSTTFETQSESGESGDKPKKSPEQLEREIDQTREELAATLDALQAKLSVRRKVHSALDSARDNGLALADIARNTVRNYPVPTLVAGVSVVLLMALLGRRRRR
jgi:hypothetical protein